MAKKSNKAKAIRIQKWIDSEFGFDIAAFQRSELKVLAQDIKRFLDLDVETEDLVPVGDLPLNDGDSDE